MSISMPIRIEIDKNKPLITHAQQGDLVEGDALAQDIRVRLVDREAPVILTGYTATAEMQRADGKKVPCDTKIAEDDTIAILLNAHCYAVPGDFMLALRLFEPETGVRRTILRIMGRVIGKGDGAIVNIENYIPSLEDLFAEIENMRTATAAANAASISANMNAADANAAASAARAALEDTAQIRAEIEQANQTLAIDYELMKLTKHEAAAAVAATEGWASVSATAEGLAPGSAPTVILTGTNKKNLHFGIPAGEKPVKGIDYFTDADKNELVNLVLDAMPQAEGVGF